MFSYKAHPDISLTTSTDRSVSPLCSASTPSVAEKTASRAHDRGEIKKAGSGEPTFHSMTSYAGARRVAQIRMSVTAPTKETDGEWVYPRRSIRRKGAVDKTRRAMNSRRKRKSNVTQENGPFGKRDAVALPAVGSRAKIRQTYRYGRYTPLLLDIDNRKRKEKDHIVDNAYMQNARMRGEETLTVKTRRRAMPPRGSLHVATRIREVTATSSDDQGQVGGCCLCSALGSGLGVDPVIIESDSCDDENPTTSRKRLQTCPTVIKVEKSPERRAKRRDLDSVRASRAKCNSPSSARRTEEADSLPDLDRQGHTSPPCGQDRFRSQKLETLFPNESPENPHEPGIGAQAAPRLASNPTSDVPSAHVRRYRPQLSIDTPKMNASELHLDSISPTSLLNEGDSNGDQSVDPAATPLLSEKESAAHLHHRAFCGDIFDDFRRIHAEKRAVDYIAPEQRQIEGAQARQESLSSLCERISDEVQTEYPGLSGPIARVFSTIKYLVDCAVFSGYTLKSTERLAIFVFLCGRDWRCHDLQLFRYCKGVWQRWDEILDFTAQEELIATEGVFISLADPDLDWSWLRAPS